MEVNQTVNQEVNLSVNQKVNQKYTHIKVRIETKKRLEDLKKQYNMKSIDEVINALIDRLTKVNSEVNQKVNPQVNQVNQKLTYTDLQVNQTVNQRLTHTDPQVNQLSTVVNHIPSNSPQRLTSDDYLDNNDFQEMMDAIKTAIVRGERNKVLNILRYFLGDKLLTIDQYEKLTRQYEWIKEMLIFNGRGYKVQ